MDTIEIPYLLRRARTHRLLGQVATCGEVQSTHRQFVRNYQCRLLEIRRERLSPHIGMIAPRPQPLGWAAGLLP